MAEKFVRFTVESGREVWGKVVDESDISNVKAVRLDGEGLEGPIRSYERLSDQLHAATQREEITITEGRFLPPVNRPPDFLPNIYAVGLNYYEHGAATGQLEKGQRPGAPILFPKWTTSVTSHTSPIILPASAPNCVDYEVELALIIGKEGKNIPPEAALEYVLGFTIGNDVSARDVQGIYPQIKPNGQWGKAKSFDTFCPLGPFLVMDIDPQDQNIMLYVDGDRKQLGNTGDMMYSLAELIAYISLDARLLPGTVLLTGTPKGTQVEEHHAGRGPSYLKAGQEVVAQIGEVGTLVNCVQESK